MNSDQSQKILLLVTAGGADWVAEPELKVDALTCALRIEYGDDLISLITDWINRDQRKDWEPDDYIAALRFFSQVNVIEACGDIRAAIISYQKAVELNPASKTARDMLLKLKKIST